MIPQTNAQLMSVTRGGFSEDYDRTAGADTTVWHGNVDAYVQRKIRTSFNDLGTELNRALDVTLIVAGDFPLPLETGDVVIYQAGNPDSLQTFAGRIQNVVEPAFMAMMPDYYRCALEEIEVPAGV